MPTFAEITKEPEGYRIVPQVARDCISLLWHSDFWDGPISGLLVFKEDRSWFQMIAENEDEDLIGWYRRFVIVRLTAEQLAEEERWEELFREKVGWREIGIQPQEKWQDFYKKYESRVPLDISANEVLGWYED